MLEAKFGGNLKSIAAVIHASNRQHYLLVQKHLRISFNLEVSFFEL